MNDVLVDQLDAMDPEERELALCQLDRNRQSSDAWRAWLERQLELAQSTKAKDRDARRRAAESLWLIAGARYGAKFVVSAKPHLYDARIWPTLIPLVQGKDNVLARAVRDVVAGYVISHRGAIADLIAPLKKARREGADWVDPEWVRPDPIAKLLEAIAKDDGTAARAALRKIPRARQDDAWEHVVREAEMNASYVLFSSEIAAMGETWHALHAAKRASAAKLDIEPLLPLTCEAIETHADARLVSCATVALGYAIASESKKALALAKKLMKRKREATRIRASEAQSIALLTLGDRAGLERLYASDDVAIKVGLAWALFTVRMPPLVLGARLEKAPKDVWNEALASLRWVADERVLDARGRLLQDHLATGVLPSAVESTP